MKRVIPYIAFACLTSFSAISGSPVISGGCSNQMNKKVEIKCAENDIECQAEKASKFGLKNSLKS